MSFSSRDISRAIQSGHPPGSPGFGQALMSSRDQRQKESHHQYGEGVLRNNHGGQPAIEALTARAAVAKLTEFHVRHARPECARLEIYPSRFAKEATVWGVWDAHDRLQWIIEVYGPGKFRNIWRA